MPSSDSDFDLRLVYHWLMGDLADIDDHVLEARTGWMKSDFDAVPSRRQVTLSLIRRAGKRAGWLDASGSLSAAS